MTLPQNGPALRLTKRQTEVLDNLPLISADGSRHDPQFRLGDKNVSRQVRSLQEQGLIDLRDGRFVKTDPSIGAPVVSNDTAVSMMRDLLGCGPKP